MVFSFKESNYHSQLICLIFTVVKSLKGLAQYWKDENYL